MGTSTLTGVEGKVYVVAGGATGIGAATAKRLAARGAHVVIGDLNAGRADQTVAEIVADGGNAVAVTFDISDETSVRELIRAAVSEHGRLDGVHANAADLSDQTFGADTDVVSVDLAVWHRTLAVDLTGHMFVARHAVPELLRNGGGALVHTSSCAAFMGETLHVAYGVAKVGLTALVRHIAARWGKENVRANAVAPGLTLSETVRAEAMTGRAGWHEEYLARAPAPRLGTPEDIASVICFLLSPDAAYVNGQTYGVDGGYLLR